MMLKVCGVFSGNMLTTDRPANINLAHTLVSISIVVKVVPNQTSSIPRGLPRRFSGC